MLYRWRLLLAKRMAAIRLHRSIPTEADRHRKSRTLASRFLIPLGNIYLSLQQSPSLVLPLKDWISWEIAVGAILNRDVTELSSRTGIEGPWITGISLKELLRTTISGPEKQRAVFLAARTLRQLHQCRVSTNEIQDRPLSHGDAACQNVIVDLQADAAHWIDFDMRHRSRLAVSVRRVDDLRVLIWSVVHELDHSEYRDAIEAACNGYADPAIFREVRCQTQQRICPTVFELAQSPLSNADLAVLKTEMNSFS